MNLRERERERETERQTDRQTEKDLFRFVVKPIYCSFIKVYSNIITETTEQNN
jgi:hypothetical protein